MEYAIYHNIWTHIHTVGPTLFDSTPPMQRPALQGMDRNPYRLLLGQYVGLPLALRL